MANSCAEVWVRCCSSWAEKEETCWARAMFWESADWTECEEVRVDGWAVSGAWAREFSRFEFLNISSKSCLLCMKSAHEVKVVSSFEVIESIRFVLQYLR